MPYVPKTWADGPAGGTPILAADLNHLENGVASAYPIYNVKDSAYGAKGDGTTDDTAAIQAALDAAAATQGVVLVPASATAYVVSNLKMTAKTVLRGEGMIQSVITAKTGATGNILREKTAGEGNANGATEIWVRDIGFGGNSTADGVSLGNQGGAVLNSPSGVVNVFASGFSTGTGISILGNAVQCSYLWSSNNNVGIKTAGGANSWVGLWAEFNATYDLQVTSASDSFFHTQIESHGGTVTPLRIEGGLNRFYGIYISLDANNTNLIEVFLAPGCTFHDVALNTNGFTYSNLIHIAVNSFGTGSSTPYVPLFIDGDTAGTSCPIYLYDTTSDFALKIQNGAIDSHPVDSTSIGSNSRMAVVNAKSLRTEHVGAATPTGGSSGDIKVGNGKLWANDAGTWKSATIT